MAIVETNHVHNRRKSLWVPGERIRLYMITQARGVRCGTQEATARWSMSLTTGRRWGEVPADSEAMEWRSHLGEKQAAGCLRLPPMLGVAKLDIHRRMGGPSGDG